jgi:hypothetical protein
MISCICYGTNNFPPIESITTHTGLQCGTKNENEKQQYTKPTCQCETVGGKDLFPSIPKKEKKNAITMGFK